MNENEFNQQADSALARIETALDNCGGDVECNRSGNVLEIEFDNGQKIIVNRHDANHEIWVAAISGGFHYAWQNGAWRSRRDGSELFGKLVELVRSGSGETLTF
ncbi:MAG: iron donor protein CyaY [Gallionellales bacterium RIFCSPLOWO2_12_FULL_59_22]|nr:MAG: iron donor protein CyaY [Gallionellales bacterium RIFCSPLOWO2_02_FULL_59_110]OGT13947.1 MAG: iron donor protein CyaY [Gallionellales bacterium RIFCSPLOWO2_12_FULL_59_22]